MLNPCNFCSAKCCKQYLITVTSFDILRILKNTNKKLEDFAELSDPPTLNADQDTILECYKNGERFDYVLAFKSHPCTFLGKDDRCTVYEFAPLTCKTYPFDPKAKLSPNSLCPLPSKLLFKFTPNKYNSEKYSKQLLEYKKIVKEWNHFHGKIEDCLNFLLNKSQKPFKL